MTRLKIWWITKKINRIRRRAALRAHLAGNTSLHLDDLIRAGIRDAELLEMARLRIERSRLEQHRISKRNRR